MPMLAERRRKTKWTLNPGRRALWNNDDSRGIKFGQGLMEKMGWKVGQGLGANEQGMTEPLRISMKSDCKGIGFKDTDSIEWVQQQHDFNELLGKLSASNNTIENNECNDAKAAKKMTSLEEKSKHSKTRVHYHKFTRGKDLSKYSEKDLECILGSKKELPNDVTGEKDSSDSCSKPETDQSMIYAGSMVDYFSKKIKKKGNDRHSKLSECRVRDHAFEDFHDNENEKPEGASFVKEKKRQKEKELKTCNELMGKKSNGKLFEDHTSGGTVTDSNVTYYDIGQETNQRNKCLNVVESEDFSQDLNDGRDEEGEEKGKEICVENVSFGNSEHRHLKKHKKKRKVKEAEENNLESVDKLENAVIDCKTRKCDDNEEVEIEETIDSKKRKAHGKSDEMCTEKISKPRKKKREEKVEETNFGVDQIGTEEVSRSKRKRVDDDVEHFEEALKPRKKEKRKEKSKDMTKNLECDSQTVNRVIDYKKGKVDGESEEVLTEELSKPQKKKKRKEKREEIENADVTDGCIHAERHEKKSKKKKRSREEENLIEGDEIKQDDPECTRTNVDPVEEEKVPGRQGKGSSTNDSTVACGTKENNRKSKKDECSNSKGTKESYEKKQLKAGYSDHYKTQLLGKGSAYVDSSRNKILDLICCTNVNAFQGSNLKHLQGYGIVRYITNDSQ